MQGVDNLLRAADREGRDDHLAFVFQSLQHQLRDLGSGVVLRRVLAVAVGAFNLQVIDLLYWLGVAQNVVPTTANVTTEQVTELAPVFPDIEYHLRGAQDVARVPERNVHAVPDQNR